MEPLKRLCTSLSKLDPDHDTAPGLVHPYWARKPLNVIEAIIEALTKSGDTVIDPFVGSGTVAFGALASNRRVIASDLNPLSRYITGSVVALRNNTKRKKELLNSLFEDVLGRTLSWYQLDDGWILERQRFDVDGSYRNGDFTLKPTEIVATRLESGRFHGRRCLSGQAATYRPIVPKSLLTRPVNFPKLKLLPNSRIAVPEGACLAHYFTQENRAFINLCLNRIERTAANEEEKVLLKTVLSSCIPLLRLSDKKASSQWPYWRPKSSLTSRNPLIVLRQRIQAFLAAAEWCAKELKSSVGRGRLTLLSCPVQNLIKEGVSAGSAQLVLTDPPYADQAPYLEYSSMSNMVLGLTGLDALLSKEIVRTDAVGRKADSDEYCDRLRQGFEVCCDLVKPEGFFAFFYQDRDLSNWSIIHSTLESKGLQVVEVLPLPKQRRSMKTVTSPGRTLDGDLLIVSQKTSRASRQQVMTIIRQQELLSRLARESQFNDYAVVIRNHLLKGVGEPAPVYT